MSIITRPLILMILKMLKKHTRQYVHRIEITNIDEDECYSDQEKRVYHLILKRTIIKSKNLVKVKVSTNKVNISDGGSLLCIT